MNLHPITWFMRQAVNHFVNQGFQIYQGPQVISEKINFDHLNVPDDHPSRDVQDTFWLENGQLLRTHTTAIDLLAMKEYRPPARIVIPGRCFRNEKTDVSHESTFYQLDGFVIEKNIQMGHLIKTLKHFFYHLYGPDIKIRTRPHHYPFVEPGMDIDVKLKNRWREMLGSGILHPTVLKNMNVDPKEYQGFAFGMGIDRLMMEKYQVDDIRLIHSSDLRFIKQFSR